MRPAAIDYSRVAAIYDEYCVFDADFAFFRGLLRDCAGPVLELMAGTGRLSLPLARDGLRLTCVDGSLAMLTVLRRKLGASRLAADVVCADVCAVGLRRSFDRILLPFQGLTELASREQRSVLFRSVAELLATNGEFLCTTHNPEVRLRSVDGTWRQVGEYARDDGSTLRVALRCTWDEVTRNVVGEQRITIEDGSQGRAEISLDLRFSLPTLEELRDLASAADLRVVSILGDYSGSAYEPTSSPAIIAVLRRTV